jgi:hypothetical protein
MKTLLSGSLMLTVIALLSASGACATLPTRSGAVLRQQQFLTSHPDLPAPIAEAIRSGHLITGMTVEQVGAIAGDPVAKPVRYGNVEVRLYRSTVFHQGPGTHTSPSHRTSVNDYRWFME